MFEAENSQGLQSRNSDYCDPVDGVVVLDEEYMKDRNVYGQLVTVYRYGREEDEVMGVKFSKEMCLVKEQIYPMVNAKVRNKRLTRTSPRIFFIADGNDTDAGKADQEAWNHRVSYDVPVPSTISVVCDVASWRA